MLCNDNKDVLEEFLKRTEKALGENSIEDQLHKLKKSIDKVSLKRKKLLDNYLKGIIEQDIYEETDVELKNELSSNFIINTSKPKEHKFCMFHVKHYYYI